MSQVPSLGSWLLATLPVVALVALVARSRWSSGTNAAIAVTVAVAVAVAAFGAGPAVLGVAVGKGLWTGTWILFVVWPALLLYQVCARAGLDRMGHVFSSVLPTQVENVLLLAWVFPSFVQGVAGFGTPIAVAAPLLLSMGIPKVRAVVLPLVGYHWSVTFGSMGSSFYMGALTANLGTAEASAFAAESAFLLGVNLLAAGTLVAFLHGGATGVRQAAVMLATVGGAMFAALQVTARVEPSIASLSAGIAGLGAVAVLRRLRRVRSTAGTRAPVTMGGSRTRGGVDPVASAAPSDEEALPAPHAEELTGRGPDRPWLVLLPYLYLLVSVLVVMVPAPTREFAKSHLLLGFSFPATETALGFTNAAAELYTPIALLSHPGSFVLLASVMGWVTYRAFGALARRALRPTIARWLRGLPRSSVSVLALTSLAAVLVDTGMVATIAAGAAAATGAFFPLIAPVVGALGSFTTGSTTTSNALFSALQSDVAELIGLAPSHLVAAQTTGGNVGNAVAPVVILIGATAIGAPELERDIFRQVIRPAALLLSLVVVTVAISTQLVG